MKILKLSLKGFKSFREAKLDLAGATVHIFHGQNGAGKSTVAQGIETVLTGRNAVSTRRGGGLQNCITHGEKAFHIVLKTTKAELDFRVQRSGGKVLQKDGQAVTHAQLAKRTGIAQQTWEALFHSGGFLELSAEEFKSVVADHLGISFSSSQLFSLLAERGIDVSHVQADLVKLCQQANLSTTMTARDIEIVHQVAYDFRRDVGRDMRHYESLTSEERPTPIDVEPLRMARRTLADERSTLTAKLQAGHERHALAKAREDLQADIEKATEELERLEAAIAAKRADMPKLPTGAAMKKAVKALADLLAEKDKFAKEAVGCRLGISGIKGSMSIFEDNPKGFTCETCGSKIGKAAAKRQIESYKLDLQDYQAQLDERTKTLAKLELKIEKAQSKCDQLQKQFNEGMAVESEISRLGTNCLGLSSRRTNLKERLADMPAEAPDVDSEVLRARFEKLGEQIETFDNEIYQAAQLETKAQGYDEAATSLEKVKAKHEALDALCDFLSPKGQFLQDLLDNDKVTRIESEATAALKGLLGSDWSLSMAEGLAVFHDDEEIPAALLSSGQRKVVDLVLKHAFAKATGLRTVILDNAELLDPELTEKVCEFLQAIADVQECVLVFTTREFPVLDGFQAWEVGPNSVEKAQQ